MSLSRVLVLGTCCLYVLCTKHLWAIPVKNYQIQRLAHMLTLHAD